MNLSTRVTVAKVCRFKQERSGARLNLFVRAGAEAEVSHEVVINQVKFFKSIIGVYQELESIHFLKPGVIPGAGIKILKSGVE